MSNEKTAITEEQAKRNLVKGWIKKEKWDKVYELAASGDEIAIEAIKTHNKKEKKIVCTAKQKKYRLPREAKKSRSAKVVIDYSKLEGPAKAGQRGGGGQSLKKPPVPEGHGKKTNIGNAGNRTAPPKIKEGDKNEKL